MEKEKKCLKSNSPSEQTKASIKGQFIKLMWRVIKINIFLFISTLTQERREIYDRVENEKKETKFCLTIINLSHSNFDSEFRCWDAG